MGGCRTLDVEQESLHSKPFTRRAPAWAASAAASASGSRRSGRLRSKKTLPALSPRVLLEVNCFRYCAKPASMMPAPLELINW